MARVTVEDCLEKVSNRFALTVLAARRARVLSEGRGNALVECDNKDCVTALREIGAGGVRYIEDVDQVIRTYISEQRSSFLRSVDGDHTFIEATSFAIGGGEDGDEEPDDVAELSGDLTKVALENAESDDNKAADTSDDDASAEEESAPEGAEIDLDAADLDGDDDDDDKPEGE